MASTGPISLNSVELLTGRNYSIWEMKVGAILRSRRLFKKVILDAEPPAGQPGSPAAVEREKWESANDEAFGIIVVTLSNEQAGLFIGETSAKAVWNELKRIHGGNVDDKRIDIALELKNIQMKSNESVDCYITRARSIATRSAALGQAISPRELVFHVVRGLNGKFETVASVLRPQRSISLEDVQQALVEEEVRQGLKNLQFSLRQERAFKAKEGFGRFKNPRQKSCYNCGRIGHISRNCWYSKASNERSSKGSSIVNRNANKDKRNFREHQVNIANENSVEYSFGTFCQEVRDVCFESGRSFSEAQDDYWVLDSGCTSHMSPRSDWLTDVKPIESEINLAENGRSIKSVAQGDVKLSTVTSDGLDVALRIRNVLYVPKLRMNLLSVRSLVENGNTILFDGDGAKIFNRERQLIAEAKEENQMYLMKTKARDKNDVLGNCLAANSKGKGGKSSGNSDIKMLWHLRLGHLNENYMDILKMEEMVRGLNFNSERLSLCEPCLMGKMAQKPFKSTNLEVTNRPLELIHMDLCGPISVCSMSGARYIYVLVDSYSRRIFVYFLRSKDEAFECFVEFKNRCEKELNQFIKSVRSDNGLEFVNQRFSEFFMAGGIKHQKTVPYTPQSNGVAERTNRTLLDTARTLLIGAKLPMRFWAEAVSTAAYLKNCSPRKGESMTPMEKWNGRKPSVAHLKTFGCIITFQKCREVSLIRKLRRAYS